MSGLFRPRHGSELLLFLVGSVALAVVVLALLHGTPSRFKRRLTVALTFVAGRLFPLVYFSPAAGGNCVVPFALPLGDAIMVMGGFTLGLGIFNLAHVHWTAIRRQREGWSNSVVFFAAFIGMVIAGFWHDQHGAPWWVAKAYRLLFFGLWQNLDAAMFSLLAF